MEEDNRIALAKQSLKGISLGDAFGESFFGETKSVLQHIQNGTIPETTWEFTDDTVMATLIIQSRNLAGCFLEEVFLSRGDCP